MTEPAASTPKTTLLNRWSKTWQLIKLEPPRGLFEKLYAAYSETYRHYHTPQHLSECFWLYDSVPAMNGKSAAVELALWFHDAVYDTQRNDNESQSADWANSVLESAGIAQSLCERVAQLVLSTQHGAAPLSDTDASIAEVQLLTDVDLAILGAPVERFTEYEAQIRSEFAWVPEEHYRQARAHILRQFLERQPLYAVSEIREQRETQARVNLAASIAGLV